MYHIKPLKDLTIKDNFMFGAVMSRDDNCKELLELILQIPINHVHVSSEKSILYHPEYKGVRLDVYATDKQRTSYNVEMQAFPEKAIGKRTRYYQSQLDMELLDKGTEYQALPPAYVIFICDFDPFGAGKYMYTFSNRCHEDPDLSLDDERECIFLSTKGKNADEVSLTIVNFLTFVGAKPEDCMSNFEDDFVRTQQTSIQDVKVSREMEGRYMIYQEEMKKQYNAGKVDGRIEGKIEGNLKCLLSLLESKGTIPAELKDKIVTEENPDILYQWFRKAIFAPSVEAFSAEM